MYRGIERYPDRKLDKAQILRLAAGNYIEEDYHIILMGAFRIRKTYLACAYGRGAYCQFYKVKHIRLPDLLDEWLLTLLSETEPRDLLEIAKVCHQQESTIFCSPQFDPSAWHENIGESTIADAILGRIVHDSYNILIDGEISMRKRNGMHR